MKRSKRYTQAAQLVEAGKQYSVEEAVDVLKKMPRARYNETLEISGQLGVDPKQTDQVVRGSVTLPHGTGRAVRVLVFCEADKEAEAKEAGAEYVGGQEYVEKILTANWFEFDYCIATSGMMKLVSKLGKALGPRGLMPSPKNGSVTENVGVAVKEAKRGKVDFRMDKSACIQAGLGKVGFTSQALVENVKSFLEALQAARPSSTKGEYIKSLFLSTTVSPSVRIEIWKS